MKRFISVLSVALTLALPLSATAGSSQADAAILPADEVAAFANRVQRDIASRGGQVAIVARIGRDPNVLPDGINYTHVAFWVYSQITLADGTTGTGYRVYNLYQRDGDLTKSDLKQDSPADFFAGAHRLDAGIIIPDPRLQEKLLRVIASPAYAQMHNPNYSVLANPNTDQFQNCTEHTLNVLMASIYDTSDTNQIKANIAAYFEPQRIEIDAFKRLLAPVASQALTTADHGAAVRTATFGSIGRFMLANDLATDVYHVTPDRVISY